MQNNNVYLVNEEIVNIYILCKSILYFLTFALYLKMHLFILLLHVVV